MNIALDYDGTYTADPDFWYEFINTAKVRGHDVFIVTFRDEDYDKNDELTFLEEDGVDIFYTKGVAKVWWMEQFGCRVDIWIDDTPAALLSNSSMTSRSLADWREECKLAKSA